MQKISRFGKCKALIAALSVGLVTSCASSELSDSPPDVPTSDAALLEGVDSSTPVMDDSAVFADLNGQPADEGAAMATTEAPAVPGNGDSPFYDPIGGESLGRVAYMLYGKRSARKHLVELNPSLNGVEKLSASQRVYFDFEDLKPQATYLTKDLLDRYANELASKMEAANLPRETVTLQPGETLQSLSQRLYGTTRYWTEIYLLNKDSISNYDQVRAGLSLNVYQRSPVAAPNSAPLQEPAPFMESPEQPVAQPVIPEAPASPPQENFAPPATQPEANAAPEPSPSPAPVMDPIPETSYPEAAPVATEPAAQPQMAPQAPVSGVDTQSFFSNSTNVRRMIYVGLLLLIGGLAFFLTRGGKKKSFDMLDVTTTDTASSRQKLGGKDSHRQDIG